MKNSVKLRENYPFFLKSVEELEDVKKSREEAVFVQEVSDDELEAVAGGQEPWEDYACAQSYFRDAVHINNCINLQNRQIYLDYWNEETHNWELRKIFPNCANTVEDGSWCDTNDACVFNAVKYLGNVDCNKAWA